MKPDLDRDSQIQRSRHPNLFRMPETTVPHHFAEWLDSAVDPDLIRLNVLSLEDTNPLEYLLYALPDSERRNDGRLRDKWLKKYAHTEHGGWWCSGIDLLTLTADNWGCFKPNQPRQNNNGKPIKYEHPPKSGTSIFALRLPPHLWDKIAARYSLKRYHSPLALRLQDRLWPVSFWEWVLAHPEIPLVITEGAKKAGVILTAGYVAIALPGIFNGYRQPKDEWGRATALPSLIPQLEVLAESGRDIYFAFDQDTKPKTIANVNTAITKTGKLLAKKGCGVKVITWSQPEKGVDDLIATHGEDAFHTAYNAAEDLETWLTRQSTQLTYPVACRLNKRYLGAFLEDGETEANLEDVNTEGEVLPKLTMSSTPARLIGLKSPKGTGKTEWLAGEVQKAIFVGQPVIIITHRVQLGQALCQRFGVPYVTEIKNSEIGTTLGYGLCVDSLHPNSTARFQPENWSDALIIIDECEQVFWHLLNANTEVQKQRVAILRTLKTLIQTALSGSGKVYLSDADLSDVSIDYVRSLAGFPLTPWIAVNEYQNPDDCWDIFTYEGHNPKQLVATLIEDIKAGGVPMVCCSAQKPNSKWGTRNLEAHLKKLFPQKNILRIDSESVANPNHPAYGCIAHLNEILPQYDVVLASPSIETGVSIDIREHFTGVWAIASGGMPTNSVRQAIARVRDNVPRHIWAATRGLGRIGNGSTSVKNLLASQHKLTKLNIRLLAQSQFDDDIDSNFQPESLRTWAKLAARVNLGMGAYRESIIAELKIEGHRIVSATAQNDTSEIETAIKTTRDEQYQQHCEAVSLVTNPTDAEYQKLLDKRNKTEAELLTERHGRLARRYGIEVSPPLVKKDDRGWYLELMLHYYLSVGKQFLAERDLRRAKAQLESGKGAIFQPSFNDSQLTAKVRILEILGIEKLFDPEAKFCASSELLVQMAELAKRNAWEIKTVLGVTISQKDTPIAIAQKLLRLLGLKMTYLGRFGSRQARERYYGNVAIDDERIKVFEGWLSKDSSRNEMV
ncbi:plasmid replication protein, CyRepA1 family [Pleurocapsa sp. CCALA 161]|uniref:plasmid replication protein, CyRepA1 family n=1 Tax=Pleurocapsa sp. CCALA 161 TaxID=2107688 RepID=UPI001304CD98|nr:plasmid replication protein, CyRepA1 family [Pleurocapsa sp. CCALA 161]